MADAMLQALLSHYHKSNYRGTEDQSRFITLILGNGTVVSGAVVSPEHFGSMNSEENGGTCPKDFAFSDPDPQSHVHLANVHVLTQSGTWAKIGTLRVSTDNVTCCGDIHRPDTPPETA